MAERPATKGFQKPLAGKSKPVGVAMLTQHAEGAITCSCGGFTTIHARQKVREDQAQRHLDKKHGGSGLWM